MTAKHTPGPWSVLGRYIETEDDLICELFGEARASRHANALLIAAAPELLDALEQLALAAKCRDQTVGDVYRLIEVKAELEMALATAKAIIAKARGN